MQTLLPNGQKSIAAMRAELEEYKLSALNARWKAKGYSIIQINPGLLVHIDSHGCHDGDFIRARELDTWTIEFTSQK